MTTTRILGGQAGPTELIASTNTAQALPSTVLNNTTGKRSNGAIITIDTNSIRYSFTSNFSMSSVVKISSINSQVSVLY